MKKCPYCAEEIQDEAVKCRFCASWLPGSEAIRSGAEPGSSDEPGSDADPAALVPTPAGPSGPPPAAPQPTAVVGQGAEAFSHSGERYVLGYGAGFFGIWDRGVPGGPSFSFPRDDAGWQQAWARFSALEPNAVEVAALTAAPATTGAGASAGPPRFESGRTLARAVVVLLIAAAAAGAIGIVLRAIHIGLLSRSEAGGDVSAIQLQASLDRVLSALGIQLLLVALTGIFWVLWQHRAQTNLPALGARDLRFTPGWAVGWWFIPFANLVMPFLTMRELSRASAPDDAGMGPGGGSPALLAGWWGAWILRLVLSFAGLIALGAVQPAPTYSTVTSEALMIAAGAAEILAAVLAISLVLRIDRNQETRRERSVATASPVGAARGLGFQGGGSEVG